MAQLQNATKVGYIDPNTYELEGYSAIGPLLLFFDKVVVYGPVYGYINQSALNKKYEKTSLTPDDFKRFIMEGTIIPLAFDTFFDKSFRERYTSPQLKIQSEFDSDLINKSSVLGKSAVIVDSTFKHVTSPARSKQIIDNNEMLKNNVNGIIFNAGATMPRYMQFKSGTIPIPDGLQKEIETDNRDVLLPYLFVYDFLNNKHVMGCQGEAEIHIEFGWLQDLYKGFHDLNDGSRIIRLADRQILLTRREVAGLIAEGMLICKEKLNRQERRLDYKFISNFREKCKDDFLGELEEILINVQTIEDRIKRKDEFCGRLMKKLKKMEDLLKINPSNIIDSTLTMLGLPEVSGLFEPFYGYIDIEKWLPLDKNWKYQFVKSRKY